MSATLRDIIGSMADAWLLTRLRVLDMIADPFPETATDCRREQVVRLKRFMEGEAGGTLDEDSDARLDWLLQRSWGSLEMRGAPSRCILSNAKG